MLPITDRPDATGSLAIIASHSFGFSRSEWIEVAELMAPHYRLIACDATGFGDAHDITGYTMADMARQFADTINTLQLDHYVPLGHSMTGKVMSILASRMGPQLGLQSAPERLILLTPTPLGPEVGGEDLRHALLAQTKTPENAERFVTDRSAHPLAPAVRERAIRAYFQANQAGWEAWLNHGIYEDWTDRCAPITIPALIIAADHDPVWGLDMQQRLTMPHFADATITTVDSGHLVPMEAPQPLAEILTKYLAS
jgi:pimeloyl-ACP methyl ester carboxylesterase